MNWRMDSCWASLRAPKLSCCFRQIPTSTSPQPEALALSLGVIWLLKLVPGPSSLDLWLSKCIKSSIFRIFFEDLRTTFEQFWSQILVWPCTYKLLYRLLMQTWPVLAIEISPAEPKILFRSRCRAWAGCLICWICMAWWWWLTR